jgi:hypothetical protein
MTIDLRLVHDGGGNRTLGERVATFGNFRHAVWYAERELGPGTYAFANGKRAWYFDLVQEGEFWMDLGEYESLIESER